MNRVRILTVWFAAATSLLAAESGWQRIAIDGEFRAEGVAMGDFNKDGRMDVAAGDGWYAAPDWKRTEIRQPLTQKAEPTDKYDGTKGYSNCFCQWTWDVNHDGWDDLITVGYPGDPFYWYENPKNQPGRWKQHLIWTSICNETPLFTDVTGDGRPDIVFGSQPERQMGYVELPPPEKCAEKWKFVPISEAGEPNQNGTFKYYHGLGVGDVNRDGRNDVVIMHGWWEAPAKLDGGLWDFHPLPLAKDNQGAPLPASNIHVIDLDLDGDSDFLTSSAHAHGIWWFENRGDGSVKYHLIDESFSQTHASWVVNLYNDGSSYLVTGKRYFAHQGKDPGAFEPVVIQAMELRRSPGQPPTFVLHEVAAGRDTGVGTQFEMNDFNRDGRLDVILSNKKGVNVLVQQ